MDPPTQIMVWTIITSLAGNREVNVTYYGDQETVEDHFYDNFETDQIEWDDVFDDDGYLGFAKACRLNYVEAALFQMQNPFISTRTTCTANFYIKRDSTVPGKNAVKFFYLEIEENEDDEDDYEGDKNNNNNNDDDDDDDVDSNNAVSIYFTDCDCKTVKLLLNGTATDEVFVPSKFTIAKVLNKHAYYHLKPLDNKYFKLVSYYEYPEEYAASFFQ